MSLKDVEAQWRTRQYILATRMFQATPPSEYLSIAGQKPTLSWKQWYADFLIYGEASADGIIGQLVGRRLCYCTALGQRLVGCSEQLK